MSAISERISSTVSASDFRAKARVILLYAGFGSVALALLGFFSLKPTQLLAWGGDNLNVLSLIKGYINGDGSRINHALGFPGVQDGLFFPSFDYSYRLFLKISGRLTGSVVATYYLLYIAGCSATFAACAYALRRLGFVHALAAISAAVFVVSPYFFQRALEHDFLSLYFSVPLGCALALRIWKDDLRIDLGTLLSIAVVGTSGLYYAFFSALFICFAGSARAIAIASIRPIGTAVIASVVIFILIVVTGFGPDVVNVIAGRVPLVQRVAAEQLTYGLTLPNAMFLLKDLPFFGDGFTKYYATVPQLHIAPGFFEWPGLFLTGIIFGAPLVLASTRRSELWFISAACIVFGIIYAIPGGYGYFFNMFVAPSIRATARVMPFLTFFALVIACGWIERLWQKRSVLSQAAAVTIAISMLAGIAPNIRALPVKQTQFPPTQPAELASVKAVLAAKDAAHMDRILQLPIVFWPEAPLVGNFVPYNHLLPFIFDLKGSQTKWSYGGSVWQPEFVATKTAVETANNIAEAARGIGFDAVLIEKRAYAQADLDTLRAKIGTRKLLETDWHILYAIAP